MTTVDKQNQIRNVIKFILHGQKNIQNGGILINHAGLGRTYEFVIKPNETFLGSYHITNINS